MKKEFINPEDTFTPMGYTHAISVSGPLTLVVISGQVAADKQMKPVALNDMEGQARMVFNNLQNILSERNLSFQDVIKLNFYLTDMNQLDKVKKVRDEYFDGIPNFPAATAVEVTRLARKEWMLEIEAWAATV